MCEGGGLQGHGLLARVRHGRRRPCRRRRCSGCGGHATTCWCRRPLLPRSRAVRCCAGGGARVRRAHPTTRGLLAGWKSSRTGWGPHKSGGTRNVEACARLQRGGRVRWMGEGRGWLHRCTAGWWSGRRPGRFSSTCGRVLLRFGRRSRPTLPPVPGRGRVCCYATCCRTAAAQVRGRLHRG